MRDILDTPVREREPASQPQPRAAASCDVCVLGLGYVGLPTAAMFASSGQRVVGVDIDPRRVQALDGTPGGALESLEPGLRELVEASVATGNLSARVRPVPAGVFIIAVPTPFVADVRAAGGVRPDLRALLAACESLVDVLAPGNLVIVESTCPPGATAGLVARVLSSGGLEAGRDFDLAYCPERMLPGKALDELVANPRTIGGLTPASAERASALYRRFATGPLSVTDCLTAEVVKLAENTFRDVNIALANELSRVCDRLGIDVREVIVHANEHPRVALHEPGVGVGGHCVSVDPWFLVHAAPAETSLIRQARQVNDAQPRWVAAQLADHVTRLSVDGDRPARVAILGMSYKPDVADTRETPIVALVECLHRLRGELDVRIHDPHVADVPVELEPWAADSLADALGGADLVVLAVAHQRLLALDPQGVGAQMAARQVFDLTGALDVNAWLDAGFNVRRL